MSTLRHYLVDNKVFFEENYLNLHTEQIVCNKMKQLRYIRPSLIIAIPVTPCLNVFEKYFFSDWEFLKYLLILVAIDSILGLWKHYIQNDVSSKGWGQLGKKFIIYSCVLILSHILASYTVAGRAIDSFKWIEHFLCTTLMVRESISIIENLGVIDPGLIPTHILTKLRDFSSNPKEIEEIKNNRKKR